MLADEIKIKEYKNIYKENNFIGGQIICDYLLIKNRKLDIEFCNNDLVNEYVDLLRKRLKTNNHDLLLMVNTEIEKCTIDSDESIYKYLDDEIYTHWKNCGEKYPKEAVGVHIDVLTALVNMYEKDMVILYLHRLESTYKEIFEEDSYYFSISWCHIIAEVFIEIMPDVAVDLYNKYKSILEKYLKGEDILYTLILKISAYKVNKSQDVKYMKDAIEYCRELMEYIPYDIRVNKMNIVLQMSASYHRNIGCYDDAIEEYKEVLKNIDNINNKLYVICQISSILYMEKDYYNMKKILKEGKKIVDNTDANDDITSEFYNMYGLCYLKMGRVKEALKNLEYAKNIAGEVYGKESDLCFKCQLNILYVYFNQGKYNTVYNGMHALMEKVINNVSIYKETLPLLLNNISIMFPNIKYDSQSIIRLRKALESSSTKYDIADNIIIYANLYRMFCFMNSFDTIDFGVLEKKVTDYYINHPYTEGYLIYLSGKLSKYGYDNNRNINKQLEILDDMERYYNKYNYKVIDIEYYGYYIIKLEKALITESWSEAKKYLNKMWDNIIFPIFKYIEDKKEEQKKWYIRILRQYLSVYVSAAEQFKQLNIDEREMYEYIMNFKYYEDLIYRNKTNIKINLQNNINRMLKNIKMQNDWLAIDVFDYNCVDLKNVAETLSENFTYNNINTLHRLYFAVFCTKGIFNSIKVKLIGDISYLDMDAMINKYNESVSFSELEKKASTILAKYVINKNKLFICRDGIPESLPLTVLKFEDNIYWGEKYQIIYCNIIQDIKKDIEIENISDSVFLGMSEFSVEDNINIMKDTLCDIPYVENEISELERITGGKGYLDIDIGNKISQNSDKNIIHIATHTVLDEETYSRKLVVNRKSTGEYTYFTYKQMCECDWSKTKLAVLSACETDNYDIYDYKVDSLRQAARVAGAKYVISTSMEVDDGANLFFMLCFYKNLKKLKKIVLSFYKAQNDMRTLTKRQILEDEEYREAGMEWYLQDYEDYMIPFESESDWGCYILNAN